MNFWREPSFTIRIALAAALSGAIPVLVALMVLQVRLPETAKIAVRDALDRDLAVAVSTLANERGELQRAASGISDRKLNAAFDTGNTRPIRDELRKLGVTANVSLRRSSARSTGDGPLATYVRRADRSLAIVQPVTSELLSQVDVSDGTGLGLIVEGEIEAQSQFVDQSAVAIEGDVVTSAADDVYVQSVDAGSGVILVASRSGNPFRELASLRGVELGGVLLALIVASIAAGVMAAAATNTVLRRFSNRVGEIAEGNYTERLDVPGSDAVAEVAQSLNSLAESLDGTIGNLRRVNEQLDMVMSSTSDGVVLWSSDGEVLFWNEGIDRLCSRGARPGDDNSIARKVLKAIVDEGSHRVLLPCGGTGGSDARSIVVDVNVSTTADGSRLQVIHDASRTLAIDAARKNFLITAAHQLRTPLAPLSGFIDLVDPEADVDDESRAIALAAIREALTDLTELGNDLFQGAVLAHDQMVVESVERDLQSIVYRAIEQAGIADHDVSVDGIEGISVPCDRTSLTGAISEVLDNARKYGSAPITVAAQRLPGPDDDIVRLTVHDRGPGISEADRGHVFEPFFRADPEMRTNVGGVGLGLFSARKFVEAMGHKMSLIDDVGEGGTTIAIDLRISAER